MDRKLELFLSSPAKDETALRDALIGKNTMQATRIIADEFERRFAGKGRTAQDVLKALLFQGRAVSWAVLDRNICELCQRMNHLASHLERIRDSLQPGWEDLPEIQHRQIEFFDKVRYILHSLPRRKDYKLSEKRADYGSPNEKAKGFEFCFLCWRSVPRVPMEKKTPLCYVHDMMSTSPEYRRRKNMRKRMLEILEDLDESVPTPDQVRKNSKLHPRDFYARQIRVLNGHFPALAEYLYSSQLPCFDAESALRSLEHPMPFDKLPEPDKAAWEFYFADMAAYFELNYERLLLAEAWLRAEAEYRHGGKRRKGGKQD